MRGGKSMGGNQDENHDVSRDYRARWVLHDNPNWSRGVCRVQGLVVQRGPNGRRARVRREAGIPVAKEREDTLDTGNKPLREDEPREAVENRRTSLRKIAHERA